MFSQIESIFFNQRSAISFLPIIFLFISRYFIVTNSKLMMPINAADFYAFGNESNSVHEDKRIHTRSLLQALDWRYTSFYMALCETNEDCKEVGFRMVCNHERCGCKSDFILVERLKFGCYQKAQIFAPCEVSEQCTAMNHNTYCNPSGRCTCSLNYYFDGRECSIRYDSHNLKAQEVYKAAVVAAACFIVAIVGIFVACIVRRSFCRREQNIQQSATSRNGDVFSISDEIAALRAVDKPPSYEEVLQIERTFYGIPPPEYTASRSDNLPTPTSPMTCTAVQTSSFQRSLCQEPSLLSESTCTSSGTDSATINLSKESDVGSVYSPETLEHFPSEQATRPVVSNFLATAEVLSPPLDDNIQLHSTAQASDASSQNRLPFHYLSSTPPPRLQHPPFVMTHTSSSLPASPALNSHHKLASPLKQQKGLLKQNLPSSVLPSTCIFESSSSLSSAGAVSCHLPDVETRRPSSSVAYDNPGFVPDSQDFCNNV